MAFKHLFYLLPCFLAAGAPFAAAQNPGEVCGKVLVQDAGSLMLDGKRIYLWGIDPLAGDQQCWIEERAWPCGEQAVTALKHFAEGRLIKCTTKEELGRGAVQAQCVVQAAGKSLDIAQYMVSSGWALDRKTISGGLYAAAEVEARQKRAGMWSGRFQTPADWSEGVQRYIDQSTCEPGADPHSAKN